jgi:hypothetical protein
MNDDKTLTKTTKAQIYECETGESITLYLPLSYNNYLLENYTVNLHWLSSDGLTGDIITAQKIGNKSSYTEYNIPIPMAMSKLVGDITVWIEILGTTGTILKTDTSSIGITSHLKISTFLNDSQLSYLEQFEIKMEQYRYEFEQKKTQINELRDQAVRAASIANQILKDIESRLSGGGTL